MKKHLNKIVLLAMIILGAFVRLNKLGTGGIGFFRDEAAIGLNTWSIIKTGADEFGHSLPLFFRSFEVFFMPAYEYLSVPFFLIFGPTEFSARALSAFSGILLIFVAYLISKELFKSERIGIITALVVSIAPWSIFYSRGAFEGNLALLFFSLGFYFWLKFFNSNNKKLFFLSLLLFVLSMYSYQAPRFVAPFFIALSILLNNNWTNKLKLWIFGGIFTLLLYLPILIFTFSPAGNHRALGVSIFSSQNPVPGYNQEYDNWQKIYLVPKEVLSLYLHYFSPMNLFSKSDYNPQRIIPNFSVFYLWMLPFLLIGLINFLKSKLKNKKALLLWLLISPIPAALTRDPFHTYRSILFYLPVSILIGFGISKFIDSFKKYRSIILLSIVVLSFYSVSSFFFSLFKVAPVTLWREWDYGYKEITEYVKDQPNDLRVVIDDPYTESYIHFLFYGVIPIKEYQEAASRIVTNQYYKSSEELRPKKVGRFEFRVVDWPSERGDKNTLFIFPSTRLYPSEFSNDPNLSLVKTIYSPGGDPAFYLIKSVK